MKKSILLVFLTAMSAAAFAQNGLEGLVVEKYYISDANDTMANMDGGVLPVGSVTYRLYADMLPGYRFQAVYGENYGGGAVDHFMRLSTTTLFFNNEDRGATTPTYTKSQAADNTVMLDSWVSVGAACKFNYGIMKSQDDGMSTIMNAYLPPVLQHVDTAQFGIPLTQQDGIIAGNGMPEPVTLVGINNDVLMFDNQNDGTNGPLFESDNGSWAALNGAVGPDSVDNKVLIGQFTTDGDFCYELNIQIGTPTGGVEKYVADTTMGAPGEIFLPSLKGCQYPVGINENQATNGNSLSVYPNPVQDLFTLDIRPAGRSRVYYHVTDDKGRDVIRKNLGEIQGPYKEYVDLSGFAKGVYLVEVVSNGSSSLVRKIVKD